MKNIFLQLRKDKGLTQLELSRILSVRQTAVSKWERGQTMPDYPTLINIAKFFEVTTDELLGLDDFGNVATITGPNLNTQEQRLLVAFRALDERRQDLLIEDAEYYAKKNVKV